MNTGDCLAIDTAVRRERHPGCRCHHIHTHIKKDMRDSCTHMKYLAHKHGRKLKSLVIPHYSYFSVSLPSTPLILLRHFGHCSSPTFTPGHWRLVTAEQPCDFIFSVQTRERDRSSHLTHSKKINQRIEVRTVLQYLHYVAGIKCHIIKTQVGHC